MQLLKSIGIILVVVGLVQSQCTAVDQGCLVEGYQNLAGTCQQVIPGCNNMITECQLYCRPNPSGSKSGK